MKTYYRQVADAFRALTETPQVFVADIDGDVLWTTYLKSFAPGTDPMFKTRTEHDCSCCRQFIRRAGAVVTIGQDGKIRTIWDEEAPGIYAPVAAAMRDAVRSAGISDLFRVGKNERQFGALDTRSMMEGRAVLWNHFYTGDIPSYLRSVTPDAQRGEYRTTVQVFERGLTELDPEAVETVLSLITSNALYRGEEHKRAVVEFQKAQRMYSQTTDRTLFAWSQAASPAARFRNTVIGTLVQDLSEGMDLERAVRGFETKVAPQNYKRTTALITPGMVKKAMETITELGLEPALERRFATIADVSVNDVKWVDGSVRPAMKGGLADVLMKAVKTTPRAPAAAEDISLDDFMSNVLPQTQSMELFFTGKHLGNLMTITAPVHPEPKQLFRWSNDFAWSYGGNVADSMLRQKVQSLGGRVDGVLRFSHMWNYDRRNASLMDLHVFMPGSTAHRDGCHNNYPSGQRVGWNQRTDAASGGVQDVDYVQEAPEGYVPVENITFPTLTRLKDGAYTFAIHNWTLRHPTQGGFRAEIEFGGVVYQYDHPEPLKHKEWITLAVATLRAGHFTIEHRHSVGAHKQDKWGLTTEGFVKVNTIMLSPNYWGENAVGNKHTFFVLDGAASDEDTRGFYNEFLHPRLEPHRKVFEVIADKTRVQPTPGQLAGLGFSSTKRDQVLVRVNGKRTYNIGI